MQESNEVIWTTDQITLQRWLALPKRERNPKTMGLLAKLLGVDEATLYRWRKLAGFVDEVRNLIKDNLKDDLADIYAALRKEAKAGSFQHIKLSLELVGDYVERQELTGKDGAPFQAQITHAIDPDTATSIFDILAEAGVFESGASDAAPDEVHS